MNRSLLFLLGSGLLFVLPGCGPTNRRGGGDDDDDSSGDDDDDSSGDDDDTGGKDTPWDCSTLYVNSQLFTVNSGRTYSIDVTNAHVEEFADYSDEKDRPLDPNSAAFGPRGQAWVSDSGSNTLMALDVCEADVWVVGSTGFNHLCGISYASDGELYGMDSNTDSLVHLNTETGAGTAVGPLGRDIGNCGMTLDCLTGTLYGVDGPTGELFEVNPKTGAAGKAIDFNLSAMQSVGLEFDPADSTLLMTDGPDLYRMDPSTGALTTIGAFDLGGGGAHFNDLAYHLGALPCDE